MLRTGSGINNALADTPVTTTAARSGGSGGTGVNGALHATHASYQLVVTDGAGVVPSATGTGTSGGLSGTWKIETSNNYTNDTSHVFGQPGGNGGGNWVDITSLFTPTIVNPSGTGQNDMVFIDYDIGRDVRITFTPTGGTGSAQRANAYYFFRSDS